MSWRTNKVLDAEEEGVILALWSQKLDTKEIADLLGRFEHEVANRLMHIRHRVLLLEESLSSWQR